MPDHEEIMDSMQRFTLAALHWWLGQHPEVLERVCRELDEEIKRAFMTWLRARPFSQVAELIG